MAFGFRILLNAIGYNCCVNYYMNGTPVSIID